jgi:hypothetical protein
MTSELRRVTEIASGGRSATADLEKTKLFFNPSSSKTNISDQNRVRRCKINHYS